MAGEPRDENLLTVPEALGAAVQVRSSLDRFFRLKNSKQQKVA